jgi:hypothetical protein
VHRRDAQHHRRIVDMIEVTVPTTSRDALQQLPLDALIELARNLNSELGRASSVVAVAAPSPKLDAMFAALRSAVDDVLAELDARSDELAAICWAHHT